MCVCVQFKTLTLMNHSICVCLCSVQNSDINESLYLCSVQNSDINESLYLCVFVFSTKLCPALCAPGPGLRNIHTGKRVRHIVFWSRREFPHMIAGLAKKTGKLGPRFPANTWFLMKMCCETMKVCYETMKMCYEIMKMCCETMIICCETIKICSETMKINFETMKICC